MGDQSRIIGTGLWDDWRWAGQAVNPPGAVAAATFAEIGSTGCYAYRFGDNDAMAFHDLQIPHRYVEGTDISPHIHWIPETTGTVDLTWTMTYVDWSNATGASMNGPTTTTATYSSGASSVTANDITLTSFANDISGTGRTVSSCMHATLTLTVNGGTVSEFFLCGFDGHFLCNSLGSDAIGVKNF